MGTIDEVKSYFPLDCPDMITQRRLRDKQLLRSRAEAPAMRKGYEFSQKLRLHCRPILRLHVFMSGVRCRCFAIQLLVR